MEPQLDLAFKFAVELSKQLITLSTGIIAFTITFRKEFIAKSAIATKVLATAWMAFFISILFGVWHLMALTGTLAEAVPATLDGANVRMPAALQIGAFVLGSLFITIYGLLGLCSADRRLRNSSDRDSRR